jgi:hypothetical protein
MKIQVPLKLSLIVLILIAFSLSSCDLLDKADDVNFDATLEETIAVSEETVGTNVAYSETITLDATSDPDINEYKNKITGFTVKKVSYQIVGYDGPSNGTFSGTLSFGDASTTTPTVAAAISNLNFQTANAAQTIFDLPINQADVDKIAALLKDDKAVKIYLNGTLSATPLYASVRVILEVSVKADAL